MLSQKGRRIKGRNGRYIFRLMLEERSWQVTSSSEGRAGEDLLATDPDGNVWAVEVKTVKTIDPKHRDQAMEQAKIRKARWMLASHIHGTGSYLVQRQGHRPCVWHQNGEKI